MDLLAGFDQEWGGFMLLPDLKIIQSIYEHINEYFYTGCDPIDIEKVCI